jgi:hypothetical protein
MDEESVGLGTSEILKRIAQRINNPVNAGWSHKIADKEFKGVDWVEARIRTRFDNSAGCELEELVLIDSHGIEERIIDDLEIVKIVQNAVKG